MSRSPNYLFSFEYFRKFLMICRNQTNSEKKISKYAGKGLRKAINYWYNQFSEFDLLCMLTQHRSSYLWTNKDLLKLYHVKPRSGGINLVIKYIMFGFAKIKDDDLLTEYKDLADYIKDLERLSKIGSNQGVSI